jgi:predicted Rossmann fold nucleotide-binding protein DprA/Smf involved in DNA uptake
VIHSGRPLLNRFRRSFPARSRVMAALAGMTVVVEAGERSGSLVTAELAAGLGRAVGAIPGRACGVRKPEFLGGNSNGRPSRVVARHRP